MFGFPSERINLYYLVCPRHNGEHKLIMFEKKVLRRIFGPKTENVTYGLNPLQYPVLHNL
jgi:hypothetical protein